MTQNEIPQIEEMKYPEQGRSMIEMLGTLAIMGVLSIGGIAGYSYAVTKYKANETMEELNNRAIVYTTQLQNGDLLSGTALRNGEFGDRTLLGYGVSATVSGYENEFNVTLSEVPFEVCEQILKNYTIPAEMSVNGRVYNDITQNIDICGEGTADMVFAFNGDLSNDWELVEVSEDYEQSKNDITTVHNLDTTTIFDISISTMTETLTWTGIFTGTHTNTLTGTYENSLSTTPVLQESKCCDQDFCSGTSWQCNGSIGSGVSNNTVKYCSVSLSNGCELSTSLKTSDRLVSNTKIDGKIWVASKENMNWYEAYNFCAAQGLTLVPYDVIQSNQSELHSLWESAGLSKPIVWTSSTDQDTRWSYETQCSTEHSTCNAVTQGVRIGSGWNITIKGSYSYALCYGDSLDGWSENICTPVAGETFSDDLGNCYSCESDNGVLISTDAAKTSCTNCGNRKVVYSSGSVCFKDCPEGQMIDTGSFSMVSCVSCSTTSTIYSSNATLCGACGSKRYLNMLNHCDLADTSCTGAEGSVCTMSNGSTGACLNGQCANTLYLTYNQAQNYCVNAGGLPSVADVAAKNRTLGTRIWTSDVGSSSGTRKCYQFSASDVSETSWCIATCRDGVLSW